MPAPPPFNFYRFVEEWSIPFPPEAVWDVMADARLLPLWWKGVYLKSEPLDGYDRPRVGAAVRAQARGFLPYRLNFTIEATELERPNIIAVKTVGDLTGTCHYTLRAVAPSRDLSRGWEPAVPGGTKVVMDERMLAEKPLLKLLTPLLKPLFAANHRWTTPRAERGLTAYLERHAARV